MRRTKAAFRAIREECGLTQRDVADEIDVRVLSVKRWEAQSEENMPPDAVWEWLLDCRAELHEQSLKAYAATMQLIDEADDDVIYLTYYRDQEQLDDRQLAEGYDRPVGFVNAITRNVAEMLEAEGLDVMYVYPEIDDDFGWHGYGWYRIRRPLGQEQMEPQWVETKDEHDGLVEWAKNDLQGAFQESLTWVEYLGDGETPEE